MNAELHSSAERHRPEFLCLGPERTGSTWLYANLIEHPDLYLPPVKEIRYFYEAQFYPDETWRERLAKDGNWHAKSYRKYLRKRCRAYARNPLSVVRRPERLRWDWRYLFARHDDAWYRSLFDAAGVRQSGEVSPQYFVNLNDESIERIRCLYPDLKLIVVLRDPIDWCWSLTRMSVVRKTPIKEVPDEKLVESLDRMTRNCSYLDSIEKWQRHFPPKQLFIGFHDVLSESPLELYSDVCSFLGVDPQAAPQSVLNGLARPVNAGRSNALPDRFAALLARGWQEEIDRLCEVFEPYPQRWKRRCESILKAHV